MFNFRRRFPFNSIVIVILLFISLGCPHSNDIKNNNTSGKTGNQEINLSNDKRTEIMPEKTIRHRMTFEKFQEIRNGTQLIDAVYIYYITSSNYDSNGYRQLKRKMFLQSIYSESITFPLESVVNYKCDYKRYNNEFDPPENINREAEFAAALIDTEILDYIQAYPTYFFDGAEYTELGDPHEADNILIMPCDYGFTLSFLMPDRSTLHVYDEWAISKASDDPESDPILRELLNAFEENFMSYFEQ